MNQVYDKLAAACRSLFDLVLSFLPLATPNRSYINTKVLELIDQRDIAARHNLELAYNALEKDIRREVKHARNSYIREQIENEKWKRIKLCKPFVAKPISIKDSEGKLKPIQDSADIIARYYRDHQ